MEGEIESFHTSAQRRGRPLHQLWSTHGGLAFYYLGSAVLHRCDSVLVPVDLHITTDLNPYGRWFPWLLVNWGNADLCVRLDGVSNNDACTDNQAALKFLRDYVKNNWWELYSAAVT